MTRTTRSDTVADVWRRAPPLPDWVCTDSKDRILARTLDPHAAERRAQELANLRRALGAHADRQPYADEPGPYKSVVDGLVIPGTVTHGIGP